jgi:SAM-dependent methyltransferase
MDILRRLAFCLRYYRHPPWESGIVPPEVVDFIATHPSTGSGQGPGRALDLGCGSGTSSLALARAGWQVTGIDFVPRAIRLAKQKAKIAGLSVNFLVADAARLPPSLFTHSYSLVLDIGCFHGLDGKQKRLYLANLPRLLAPGGTWLLYGFLKPSDSPGPGLNPDEIAQAQETLELIKRQDGTDRGERPSAWLWYRKGTTDDRR